MARFLERFGYPWRTVHEKQFGLLLSGLFLLLCFQVGSLSSDIYWGTDTFAYLLQTECLLSGELHECSAGIASIAEYPGQLGPSLYPWGFPVLLLPVVTVFGADLWVLKLFNFTLFSLTLILLYRLFTHWVDGVRALLLVVLTAATYRFHYQLEYSVLSEPASFLITVSVLLCLQRIYFTSEMQEGSSARFLLGGLLFFAFAVRSSNIILLPLVWLVQLWVRRSALIKPKVFLLESVPTVVWGILSGVVATLLPSGSYANHFDFSQLGNVLNGVIEAVVRLVKYLIVSADAFLVEPSWFDRAGIWELLPGFANAYLMIYVFVAPVVVWLLFARGVRKSSLSGGRVLMLGFIFFTFALYTMYPYYIGVRAVLVTVPFVLFFVFAGVDSLDLRKSDKYSLSTIFAVCYVTVSLVSTVVYHRVSGAESLQYSSQTDVAAELITYVKNTYDDSNLLHAFAPRQLYYETGVPAVMVHENITAPRDYQLFPEIDAYIESKALPFWEEAEAWLEENGTLVFENDVYVVYEPKN